MTPRDLDGRDGGPAFPVMLRESDPPMRDGSFGYSGMGLRDYFAGQALAGLLAMASHPDAEGLPHDEADYLYVAGRCYTLADAMIAEREK